MTRRDWRKPGIEKARKEASRHSARLSEIQDVFSVLISTGKPKPDTADSCPICSTALKGVNFKSHYRDMHQTARCKRCRKVFANRAALETHSLRCQ